MILNYNKKNLLLVVAFVISVFCANAKEIVLGGKNGWQEFQYTKNITTGKGRYGYDCIQIASNSFDFDEYTDLLIDFENPENPLSDGDYTVNENNLKISNQTKMEKQSGLSRNMGGLKVSGLPGTFFGSEGLTGSFSLEFWLCPSLCENGEVIVNWESTRNESGRLVYQMLNGTFNKGHLEWTLTNFFDLEGLESGDIILKGSQAIIPDTWSYHALSYDCETGILEYLVNGVTEDLKYITSDGTEKGDIALVNLGSVAELSFCDEYTGKIDDIRILRRPYSIPDFQSAENAGKLGHTQFVPQGGRFVSKPMLISTGSRLTEIQAEMSVPSQTAVCYFVRSGENYYNWTENYPAWKPVESGQAIDGVTGLYFQVAAELYPDGNGETSPSITQISLNFEEIEPPLPPFIVKAVAGNGKVTVSWSYSADKSAGGYYLYYGNRPGEYLGRVALEGDSPVNVGNTTSFTLTGLENGRIYYFAVAGWSTYDERVIGNLSQEVFARPLARLK